MGLPGTDQPITVGPLETVVINRHDTTNTKVGQLHFNEGSQPPTTDDSYRGGTQTLLSLVAKDLALSFEPIHRHSSRTVQTVGSRKAASPPLQGPRTPAVFGRLLPSRGNQNRWDRGPAQRRAAQVVAMRVVAQRRPIRCSQSMRTGLSRQRRGGAYALRPVPSPLCEREGSCLGGRRPGVLCSRPTAQRDPLVCRWPNRPPAILGLPWVPQRGTPLFLGPAHRQTVGNEGPHTGSRSRSKGTAPQSIQTPCRNRCSNVRRKFNRLAPSRI